MDQATKDAIFSLIDKMKVAASADREAISADLKTLVMMASDPELDWYEQPPVILTQGQRVYRAYPIQAG